MPRGWLRAKTNEMGRKRRTRRARWRCTACARDVEGFVIIVVVVAVVVGSPPSSGWFMAKRYETLFFHERLSLAPVRGVALREPFDEFYVGLLLTSEHPVQRSCDLSRRRAWKGESADDIICASPEASTCTTAGQIKFRDYENFMRGAASPRTPRFGLTLIQLILCSFTKVQLEKEYKYIYVCIVE